MKSIRPILLLNFLGMMAMMALLPVIGPIVREVGLQEWHAGVITGISGVFWMLCARFWGTLSDKQGRKKVLLIGFTGFCIAYIGFSVFIDYSLQNATTQVISITAVLVGFIAFRSVMGIFCAALQPASTAYIADVTTKNERTAGMALFGASSGFAMIAGPIAAGLLAKQGLAVPMYAAACIPVLCILITIFVLKPHKNNRIITEQKPVKLSDIRLRLPILAAFLSSSCVYTVNMCIGFYGIDVLLLSPQAAAENAGYAMGIVGVCMIAIQIVISKLTHVSPITWIRIGSILGAIGMLIVVMVNTKTGLYIGYAFAALGIGAIFPSMQSLASQRVSENEQGIAAGSVSAAQGLAMVIAPVMSTAIYEINPLYPYITATALMLLLFVCVQGKPKLA